MSTFLLGVSGSQIVALMKLLILGAFLTADVLSVGVFVYLIGAAIKDRLWPEVSEPREVEFDPADVRCDIGQAEELREPEPEEETAQRGITAIEEFLRFH